MRRIGGQAFRGCRDLLEIEIPAMVEEIGERCFSGCSLLSSVTFADRNALKRIGPDAFKDCNVVV